MARSTWLQLRAVLWKNWMLKKANKWSFLAELLLPAVFMYLLVYIKSISTVFESPTIAYYCGNAFPWYYSHSLTDSIKTLAPFSCVLKPTTCHLDNYYMIPIQYENSGLIADGYMQYGFIQSPATAGKSTTPFYTMTIADKSSIYNELSTTNPSLPFSSIVKRLVVFRRKLAIAPKSAKMELEPYIEKMIAFLEKTSKYDRTNFIIQFSSEAELHDYVTHPQYDMPSYGTGKVAFAIIVNDVKEELGQWDYSIRVNYTSDAQENKKHAIACLSGPDFNSTHDYRRWKNCDYLYHIPSTKFNTIDLFKPQTARFINGYLFSGFSALQQTIDEFIFSQYGEQTEVIASVSPFPTESFTSDTFQYVISSTLGMFYMLSYLYPVSQIVRALVLEKEMRIKEGMKMMGLTDFVYNMSWLIVLFCQMTVVSALITLVTADSVFEYSNNVLVFVFFEAFSLSVLGLCFLLSTFFSRAKVASLLSPMIFFGLFFPFFVYSNEEFSVSTKSLSCLSAPTCFALGGMVFGSFEGGQVGINYDNMSQITSNMSYTICVSMMLLDAIIYSLLAWYLDNIFPSEFGSPRPFYFIFLPSYWFEGITLNSLQRFESPFYRDYSRLNSSEIEMTVHATNTSNQDSKYFEKVSNDLLQQSQDMRCISIQGLGKVFQTTGGERVAVDNLNAEMYEGQVTVLLGHNGAGKSSTINMLVGLTPPSSGDAIIRGKRISSEMHQIRHNLGVCPQHDILFPDLTVLQHLLMFASFKGITDNVYDKAIKMIVEVGLLEKATICVKELSGGQKRKLSLGIALIGDSSVVILDEPTSGMDPYSRRSTWDVIQRNKKGRIILLTTHFMDEADILADRIMIMSEGKLQVVGSPLFLKSIFGVGYTLHLTKISSSQDNSQTEKLIIDHIEDSQVISDVGSELSFRIPFAASSKLPTLFNELDNLKSVHSCIKDYGISVTTLEEVFIRVDQGLHSDKETVDTIVDINTVSEKNSPSDMSLNHTVPPNDHALFKNLGHDNIFSRLTQSTFSIHLLAFLNKRYVNGKRDYKMMICQLVLPVLLLIVGLSLLLLVGNFAQPDLILSSDVYNPTFPMEYRNFVPFTISKDNFQCTNISQHIFSYFDNEKLNAKAVDTGSSDYTTDSFEGCSVGAEPLRLTSNYLINNQPRNEHGSSRYGAITMSSLTNMENLVYNVMVNESAIHGVGVYVNLVHSAYLKLKSGISTAKITTHNYPLPPTYEQSRESTGASAFIACLFLATALCFIPGSYTIFIVKEFEVKSKFQQQVSGSNMLSFWFANIIWDVITYIPTAVSFVIVFYMYDVQSFLSGESFKACILLLVFYGPAVASFTYFTSFTFTTQSTAQLVQMLGSFVTGLCMMIVHFVLTVIPSTSRDSFTWRYIFRLFPTFCVADGFLMLALCQDGQKCPNVTKKGYDFNAQYSPLSWEVTGANITFLAIQSLVYFAVTVLIEYSQYYPAILSYFQDNIDVPLDSKFYEQEDFDVSKERNRINTGDGDSDVVRLDSLRKVYRVHRTLSMSELLIEFFKFIWNVHNKDIPTKIGIQSLSIGIPKGECFGLLGINGSGKTTTLSILCGQMLPSSGTAYIDGHDIRFNKSKVCSKVGYCPQFDALLELLTVREHLELFAAIKTAEQYTSVTYKQRQEALKQIIESILDRLDLRDYENKAAGSLSGGNKRKLSVAIALIGNPSIVYLDEPSTGMDPVARRFMWDVISRVSTRDSQCSVLLTTHSMEEAEALSTRIGVMVNGQLRCLGSSQHIKQRFGTGFEINVKTKIPNDDSINELQEKIRNATDVTRNISDNSKEVATDSASLNILKSDPAIDRLSMNNVFDICSKLGNPNRLSLISQNACGRLIQESIQSDGFCTLTAFACWWASEDQADRLATFMEDFSELEYRAELLERSTAHSFRYRLRPVNAGNIFSSNVNNTLAESDDDKFKREIKTYISDPNIESLSDSKELFDIERVRSYQVGTLANIFQRFEDYRIHLQIEEYSISQTTLEQVFNQLAASQDNPEIASNMNDDRFTASSSYYYDGMRSMNDQTSQVMDSSSHPLL